jgi:ELWxxDGT repeat protein
MNVRKFLALCGLLTLSVFPPNLRSQEARLLTDLNPGPIGSYPSNFTSFAGQVYFSAYTQETGFELFRFDGTNVSLAANINDTVDDIGFGVLEGNDSVPSYLTELNGTLFLSAFEPRRGAEVWKYDGNAASRVSDINADANDTVKFLPKSSWPQELVVMDNRLYFSATSRTNPPDYELWQFDGATVSPAANIRADLGTDYGSYPQGLTAFDGSLFFMANDGTTGWELYRHNSAGATLMDLNTADGDNSSYPKYFTALGTNLYFQAFTGEAGFELWKTDGTRAEMAANIAAGANSSYPQEMTIYRGAVYFRATDDSNGFELWKYDGTSATLAADINPGGDGAPKEMHVFNNNLFFAANDGVHGWELWKYDGTNALMVTDLNTGGDAFPNGLHVHAGYLYFSATTPETGYELFKYDGNEVSLAADLNPGAGDSFPRFLHSFNDQLIFSAAADGSSDWELWVLGSGVPSNTPPTVSITSPLNGTSFTSAEAIQISAIATDDDVEEVEFFANGVSIGSDNSAPFSITTNLPAGSYALSARAKDQQGATGESETKNITVTQVSAPEPRVTTISASATGISLEVVASVGAVVTLEGSSDLVSWVDVSTRTSTGETVSFVQPFAGTIEFFRVRVD